MRKVQQSFLKTNQTHQEYTGFLRLRMASFNQKLERRKALGGRDKSPSAAGAQAAHPTSAWRVFKALHSLCAEIPRQNADKRAKCCFVICYFLHRQVPVFSMQKYGSRMGVKVRNASGTTALGDCLCRGYFASYI